MVTYGVTVFMPECARRDELSELFEDCLKAEVESAQRDYAKVMAAQKVIIAELGEGITPIGGMPYIEKVMAERRAAFQRYREAIRMLQIFLEEAVIAMERLDSRSPVR